MPQHPTPAAPHALIKAMGHPLRLCILRVLDSGPASPSELARVLGERLGNVAYHVRVLADLGLVELARTAPSIGTS